MYKLLQTAAKKDLIYKIKQNKNSTTIWYKNGFLYRGRTYGNTLDGEGVLMLGDGSYYQGIFKNDLISEGIWVHKSGLYYEGIFHKDRFKKGTFHFVDGDIFEAEWSVKSKKYSLLEGTYYYLDGRRVEYKPGENLYIVSRKMTPEQEKLYLKKINSLGKSLKKNLYGGKLTEMIKENEKIKNQNLRAARKTFSRANSTEKGKAVNFSRIGFSQNIMKWRDELKKFELSFSIKKEGNQDLITNNSDMSIMQVNMLNNNNYHVNAILESAKADSQKANSILQSQIHLEKSRKFAPDSNELTKGKIFFADCSNGTSCIFIGQFLTPKRISTENALSIGIGGFYQEFYHEENQTVTSKDSDPKPAEKSSNNKKRDSKNPNLKKIFQFSYTPRIKATYSKEERFYSGEKVSSKILYAGGTLIQFYYNSKKFNWIQALAQKKIDPQQRFRDFNNSHRFPGNSETFFADPSFKNDIFSVSDVNLNSNTKSLISNGESSKLASILGSECLNFTVLSQVISKYLVKESTEYKVPKVIGVVCYPYGKHLISFAGAIQGDENSFKMLGQIFFNQNLCVGNVTIRFKEPNFKYSLGYSENCKKFSTVEALITHLEIQKIKKITTSPNIDQINGFHVFKIGQQTTAQGFFLNDHLIIPKQDLLNPLEKQEFLKHANSSKKISMFYASKFSMNEFLENKHMASEFSEASSHFEKIFRNTDSISTPKNRDKNPKKFNFESVFTPGRKKISKLNENLESKEQIQNNKTIETQYGFVSSAQNSIQTPNHTEKCSGKYGFTSSKNCLFCRKKESSKLDFKKSLKSLMGLLKKYSCVHCFLENMGIPSNGILESKNSKKDSLNWPKNFKEFFHSKVFEEQKTMERSQDQQNSEFLTWNATTLKNGQSKRSITSENKFPLNGKPDFEISKSGYSPSQYEKDANEKDLCLEKNPDYFRGEMKNYSKEGLIYENFEDEECFWGNYEGGYRNGFGRLFKYEKYFYEGDFQNGNKHGEGIIKFKNGDAFHAYFIKNRVRKIIKKLDKQRPMVKRDSKKEKIENKKDLHNQSSFKKKGNKGNSKRKSSRSPSWSRSNKKEIPNFGKDSKKSRIKETNVTNVKRKSRFREKPQFAEKSPRRDRSRNQTPESTQKNIFFPTESGEKKRKEIEIFESQISDWERHTTVLKQKYGLGTSPAKDSKNVLQWLDNAEKDLENREQSSKKKQQKIRERQAEIGSCESSTLYQNSVTTEANSRVAENDRSSGVRTKSRGKRRRNSPFLIGESEETNTVKHKASGVYELPKVNEMDWSRIQDTFDQSFRYKVQVDPKGGKGGKLFLRNVSSFKDGHGIQSFGKNIFEMEADDSIAKKLNHS